jgi:hypothetical protein
MAITIQTASAVVGLFGPPFPDASSSINVEETSVLSAYPLNGLIALAVSLGDASISGFGVSLDVPQTITASLGSTEVSGFASTINSAISITASLGSTEVSGFSLTILLAQNVTVGAVADASPSGLNPTILQQQILTVEGLGSAAPSAFNPTGQVGQTITVGAIASADPSAFNLAIVKGYPSFTLSDVRSTMPVLINSNSYVIDFQQFARQNAQSFRTSADEGGDAFERSISDEQQWKRTQYNWDKGAGQDWWDRRDSDRSRFDDSLGVYPWNEGKLSLYGGAQSEGESGVAEMLVAGGYMYVRETSAVKRLATASGAFSTVTGAGACSAITSDGNKVWVATGTNIGTFTGTGSSSVYSTFDAYLVGYANGRLLATDNAAKGTIYEIQDAGATSTLIWAHPNSAFEWKKIVHAPNGVYLVGDAGTQSEVYKLTVADSTGDLVPPFPAVEMEDELINDMVHYGGLFLASTGRGFRLFSVADASGHLTYGKVIEFGGNPGGGIATRGEDVYVGWGGKSYTPAGGSAITASGVAHVRLTDFTELLVPPYAFGPSYRSAASDDLVEAVAFFDGQIFWSVDGALYSDQANPAVGYVNVGNVEYGSIDESKRLTAAAMRHEPLPASTQIDIKILDSAGAATTVVTNGTTASTGNRTLIASETGERWEVEVTLTPSGANGPVLERWTLEAIPMPAHTEDIVFPVILKDVVEDEITQAEIHLDVWVEYTALKALANSREIVSAQLGQQTLSGFVYDVAIPQGQTYDWDGSENFLQGTYSVFFRTVAP